MNTKTVRPWRFIPSLYFAEGLPYILVNVLSVTMYAKLGVSDQMITFWTGWFYLPWVLKMFWSPAVDSAGTKRRWLLGCQFALAAVFAAVALVIQLPSVFLFSLLGFLAGAFLSATQDIATDGYYMLALTINAQVRWVALRTIFYRLGMIFGSGVLVMFAGFIEQSAGNIPLSWTATFMLTAVIFAALFFYHAAVLPKPVADKAVEKAETPVFLDSFKTYFSQKNIIYILLFLLLYRIGDAMLEKIIIPFLIKPAADGALAIPTADYGFIKGILGTTGVILGNLAGAALLSRFGFKKCIWWFALILILPNFFYVYMAYARPALPTVAALITLEHFGNGLALMAFTVFILYVSQGKYKTSHYAISTGIMALGMMVPSMLSGKLQSVLGYPAFFTAVSLLSLVTLAVVPLTSKIKSVEETEKIFREHKMSLEDGN